MAATNDEQKIDLEDKASAERWEQKLDVTHEQLREAVGSVGNNAAEVEMHLKGTRATTNAEATKAADKPSGS
jgi:hypothetical protein